MAMIPTKMPYGTLTGILSPSLGYQSSEGVLLKDGEEDEDLRPYSEKMLEQQQFARETTEKKTKKLNKHITSYTRKTTWCT